MAQHQAVQIRLTPAIKQALLQAQASGQPVSLSVPNLGAPVPSSDVRGQVRTSIKKRQCDGNTLVSECALQPTHRQDMGGCNRR
jgi:hypothetical protein